VGQFACALPERNRSCRVAALIGFARRQQPRKAVAGFGAAGIEPDCLLIVRNGFARLSRAGEEFPQDAVSQCGIVPESGGGLEVRDGSESLPIPM